jgi:hypothetical protein
MNAVYSSETLEFTYESIFIPEDGGSLPLRNVGIYLQIHMVLIQKTNIDN